jgi:hypothetical protein
MAIGDIKGPEAVVIEVEAGATVAVGQVVHLQADGKWDPTAAGSKGKFGVAITAAVDTEAMRIVIWGRVEVTATAAAIPKGAIVMCDTAGTVTLTDWVTSFSFENVGTVMEAIASGETGTLWVGLGGN